MRLLKYDTEKMKIRNERKNIYYEGKVLQKFVTKKKRIELIQD